MTAVIATEATVTDRLRTVKAKILIKSNLLLFQRVEQNRSRLTDPKFKIFLME